MIEKYLKTSKQLKIIFLLIDIRHEPSANDRNMYEWIQYHGYQPIIIATKSDKVSRSQIGKQVKLIQTGLNASSGTKIIPFSSLSKQGRDEIWDCIQEVMDKDTVITLQNESDIKSDI
jgi:GTP-binding protein